MHYIIQKSKWLRNRIADPDRPKGYRYNGGTLLNTVGKMCCLGFCTLQEGVPRKDIKGIRMPMHIDRDVRGFNFSSPYHVGGRYNTKLSQRAALVNDSKTLSDAQKIDALVSLFKEHGHTIEFVD